MPLDDRTMRFDNLLAKARAGKTPLRELYTETRELLKESEEKRLEMLDCALNSRPSILLGLVDTGYRLAFKNEKMEQTHIGPAECVQFVAAVIIREGISVEKKFTLHTYHYDQIKKVLQETGGSEILKATRYILAEWRLEIVADKSKIILEILREGEKHSDPFIAKKAREFLLFHGQ